MSKFQPRQILIASLTTLAAALVLAGPTAAQQARPGEQLGMRYLSWAGKPAGSSNDDLRRPGDVVPRQQLAGLRPASTSTPALGRPSRYGAGLTPASAWIPAPAAPTPAQPQGAAPQSQPQTASAPDYDAGRSFRRQDPYFAAPPQVQMAMQPAPQPTNMPLPTTIPTAVDPAVPPTGYDPMAPRRDAPIFRLGRAAPTAGGAPSDQQAAESSSSQPQPQAQAQAAPRNLAQAAPIQRGQPPREGARYYSVHREAGHEPDPMTLPESVFIGGASMDLAEPPPAPTPQRTINGRTQVIVPTQDPSLP